MPAMGTGSLGQGLCFALPPSLGKEPVRELARQFADVLYGAGFDTVVPFKTYAELERALLSGEVDAAWGPPLVCARVESAGGRVAMRAVRYGAVTYRSVLVCRAHDDLDIQELGQQGRRRPRAVWVDEWSMGGYILPRAYFRSKGIDPATAFAEERMVGSYEACFHEVLEGEADLTASFAGRRGLGYVELCGEQAFQLRTIAYTADCPNDAVVLGSMLNDAQANQLVAGIRGLLDVARSKQILASMFDVDDFDVPPPGTYSPLLALL
jgi:ABC-type phosphate/phosphonate transport system substrate-binding protein